MHVRMELKLVINILEDTMSRTFDELTVAEQDEYYAWVIMLCEDGRLHLKNHIEIEMKARAMYEADRAPDIKDKNLGLDIEFKDY